MTVATAGRRAAIDIGTVTARLIVADVVDGEIREIIRLQEITHLGTDVSSTGLLAAEPMAQTIAAVGRFVAEARRLGAEDIVCVATSASRDAENSDEFLAGLAAHGVEPQVISGEREAFLAFTGAMYEHIGEDVLVADLGGGSTELILGSVRETDGEREVDIDAARSIDVGSRRMTDRFLKSDPPTAAELREAAQWAVESFRPYFDGLRTKPRSMLALAGTATTLSAIQQEMAVYDPAAIHGSTLSGADLAMLKEDLAAMPLEARRTDVVGLDSARASVIVAGALILESLVGLAGLDGATVSEHDILYGLVLEGA